MLCFIPLGGRPLCSFKQLPAEIIARELFEFALAAAIAVKIDTNVVVSVVESMVMFSKLASNASLVTKLEKSYPVTVRVS